jgi:hypothetical protein
MKPRARIKIVIDVLMTAVILALMGRHLWSETFHERLGLCAGVLFIVHNALNRKYSEPKLLFYLDYLALMGLGVFIAHYGSKALRTFTNNKKRGIENA